VSRHARSASAAQCSQFAAGGREELLYQILWKNGQPTDNQHCRLVQVPQADLVRKLPGHDDYLKRFHMHISTHQQTPVTRQHVTLVDIQIPFRSLVWLAVKISAAAAIPVLALWIIMLWLSFVVSYVRELFR
jgi:hypothetical protein